MKVQRVRRCLASLAALVVAIPLLAGCSSGPEVRVLFIGNSHTTTNDLPVMVGELARANGRRIEVTTHAPGGWWWRDHARSEQTMDLISNGGYDVVILQEQSMVTSVASMARRESRPPAVNLALAATMTGAEVILFMTWAHRDGSAEVGHGSYESMQRAIASTYNDLGNAIGGRVAPVGSAWWLARIEHPGLSLYQPDGSHPSREGSYLAAVVIAATILRADPLEMDAHIGLDAATAEALRQVARRAINGETPR